MGVLARIGSEVKTLSTEIKSMGFSRYGGYGSYGNHNSGYNYGSTWNTTLPGSKYDDASAAGVLWENPAAAACFVALTKAFAQARPYLERRKTKDGNDWERVDHRLIELLERPNEFYSGEKMFGVTLISAMSQGAAFWYFERDGKGDPSEVWYEPPIGVGATGMAPNWDEGKFISDYIRRVDGKDTKVKREDVIYFRHGLNVANPRMPWAPLGLGAREIATLNAASTYTASIMRNNGVPLGFISLDGSSAASPENFPTPDQALALKAQLAQEYNGPHNAGKVPVTSFPWKFNKAGLSPSEMVIDQIRQWPQETICALLGTPVIVALLPTGAQPTYQNLDASMRWWWSNTILPIQDAFSDEIETQAFDSFDLDPAEYRMAWDISKVEALKENEAEKHLMWREDYKAGTVDRYTFLTKIGEAASEADKNVFHPSATPGNNQAEPLDPQEIEKQKRLNEAAKSVRGWDESAHPRNDKGEFTSGAHLVSSTEFVEKHWPKYVKQRYVDAGAPQSALESMARRDAQRAHEAAVSDAVMDGEHVPPHVLAEYPHHDPAVMQPLMEEMSDKLQKNLEARRLLKEARQNRLSRQQREALEKAGVNPHSDQERERAAATPLGEYLRKKGTPERWVNEILAAPDSGGGRRVDVENNRTLFVPHSVYAFHYSAVKESLLLGEHVPDEVLKDYPRLRERISRVPQSQRGELITAGRKSIGGGYDDIDEFKTAPQEYSDAEIAEFEAQGDAALKALAFAVKYDPNQPRDSDGKFGTSGSRVARSSWGKGESKIYLNGQKVDKPDVPYQMTHKDMVSTYPSVPEKHLAAISAFYFDPSTSSARVDFKPGRIELHGGSSEFATLHEVGHVVYDRFIPDGGWGSEDDPTTAMSRWRVIAAEEHGTTGKRVSGDSSDTEEAFVNAYAAYHMEKSKRAGLRDDYSDTPKTQSFLDEIMSDGAGDK